MFHLFTMRLTSGRRICLDLIATGRYDYIDYIDLTCLIMVAQHVLQDTSLAGHLNLLWMRKLFKEMSRERTLLMLTWKYPILVLFKWY